ncbi:MAG TPA: helix-turn-helix domain-containing protein, partial [Verrucomicrobiales bacterium]|nr:helix-turn-helix domain-containing protein [Verrucomicrobiales bacterium]
MVNEPEYFSKQVTEARRWFLALPKPEDQGIITVSVGCERCQPDYVVQRDTFDFECIEFVAEGEGSLQLNDREYALQPGVVFSYRPGIPHRIENTSRSPMLKYFLDCGGRISRQRFDQSSVGSGRIVQVGSVGEIVDLFELLISNAMTESEHSRQICALLVEALLLKITEKTITGRSADTWDWATYERIRRHSQEHCIRLKTMTELAEETGVDPAYLSRVFRRFHRMSPYRFLLRLKMSHAASLLLNPNTLVKEVAINASRRVQRGAVEYCSTWVRF